MSEHERHQSKGMVPFHRPSIGEEEIAEVVDTLRSGWLTTGPKVARFQREFAAAIGARHALAVSSATAALHLALEAVGVTAGDEVIVPTYTFTATGEIVTYLGARPVLADCRADTLNIDVTTIERHLSSRTKAIIPVHIAGQVCDMEPILELARTRGLAVVEDAAHALPATYKGRPIGTIGDLTAFSFYATKTITTGEGGMVTTNRDDHAARVKSMSLHGLSGDAWNRYAAQGRWYYEVTDFGFKYNMTDVAAALGLHQLQRMAEFQRRREQIASRYGEAFGELETCFVPRDVGLGMHAWHLYILEVNPPALRIDRNDVIERLRQRGVATSVHFIPLHLQPVYQRVCGYRQGQFPMAEAAYARAISLPIYPAMTDADVDCVIDAVRATLRESRR
ncbi:MAG TPA: DegT/DnrJ/EryC1/StrS aminotransferase family protein [Vicinamibacterales bacterium]|nr:DegT/DnrJ/EryC1/StrS aminotransferase family protein [Vicinamibacterales bacterium]